MFGLGFGELLIILVMALLFVGPKKLPELARGLGRAVAEFKKIGQQFQEEMNRPVQPSQPEKNSEIAQTTDDVQSHEKEEKLS